MAAFMDPIAVRFRMKRASMVPCHLHVTAIPMIQRVRALIAIFNARTTAIVTTERTRVIAIRVSIAPSTIRATAAAMILTVGRLIARARVQMAVHATTTREHAIVTRVSATTKRVMSKSVTFPQSVLDRRV
jgi:hypothetical protein